MAKKVLIVEDYEDIRLMMKIMIEQYGYETLEAGDGYEAVEKAAKFKPDMVLMDISMPVLDGLNATRAIRQFDEGADIPILAVTAYGDFYKDKAIDAGCNDVISKPLHFDQLQPIIERYIS